MTTIEKVSVTLFLLIVVTVYAVEMCLIFACLLNRLRGKQATNIFFTKFACFVHSLAVLGIICFLYGFFVEPYWIDVTTIEIQTEKFNHTSLRLVHISDLHCEQKVRNEEKLVKLINGIQPDIIIFTGDTLNTPAALQLLKGTLKQLKAKLAKFAVQGNFDVWYWSDLDLFGDTGFEVLDRKTISMQKDGETFSISGLSCQSSTTCRSLLKNNQSNIFNIFLYHYPDLIEDLSDLNVDLYLAGHTHGGQVAMPFYGALVTLSRFGKKYEAGMYTVNETILYINRGIGMEGGHIPRVRFFARPEVTVFDIRPKQPK